jgi:hypothetical protein
MTAAELLSELEAPAQRRTITVPAVPANTQHTTAQVDLVDAIAAVQDAGYLVYEIGELPEVTVDANGKPKLPARHGEQPYIGSRPKAEAFYEEAFGKLALARWWEAEEKRRQKRIDALRADLFTTTLNGATSDAVAAHLIERGWRRG